MQHFLAKDSVEQVALRDTLHTIYYCMQLTAIAVSKPLSRQQNCAYEAGSGSHRSTVTPTIACNQHESAV
jgi:hypothetical protein